MNKFIIIIILFLIPSCMPASKVALQRTNANVHALAVEHENLVDVVVTGLNLPPNVSDALKGNANKIVVSTEQETHKNVGIFNFDSFMGGVVSFLEKVEPFAKIVGSLIGGETGGVLVTTALTAIGAYVAHRRTVNSVVKTHEEELTEAEKEKEGIRLRLEREKEELRVKSLIKQKTMAKLNPQYQAEFDKAREEAEKELRARGEI